jgi:Domain of unknown function (DUF4389)
MADEPAYPVRLEGRRDEDLSRWLWVVKWLLAIPHYIVLAFLGIAFAVLTVVAFFAILVTGRYPRGIFDFNLGVLRWTWRVGFYSYAALGTDRYPPFSLGPEPDYPATLEIDYPEVLSRGLVLVKWWLLAIPQYILVGVFLGGTWAAWDDEHWGWGFAGGLIGVLVLFAALALVFMGRYPSGIFDLVLGLDRWVARVAAYATLMTDRYPPFRLDQGAAETERPVAAPPQPEREPQATAAPAVSTPAAPSRGGAGRVLLFVLGSIAALIAFALLAGGCAVVVVDQTQRDDDGFVMTPTETFSTETYAIVSESVDIDIDGPDWVVEDFIGTVRIRSESDRPVFVGIARDSDVERYLAGVGRAVVTDIGRDPEYDLRRGGRPRSPPGAQQFWEASTSGAGEQTLDWELEDGSWSVVVMNATGSRAVEAELSIGAELDGLLWIGLGLLAAGTLFAAGAAVAITAGARRGR